MSAEKQVLVMKRVCEKQTGGNSKANVFRKKSLNDCRLQTIVQTNACLYKELICEFFGERTAQHRTKPAREGKNSSMLDNDKHIVTGFLASGYCFHLLGTHFSLGHGKTFASFSSGG